MLDGFELIVKLVMDPDFSIIKNPDVNLAAAIQLPHADYLAVIVVGEVIPLVAKGD
jgi:hypothetical protein